MRRKRILYVAPHRPDRAPGQRFRFEQYRPFLERHGYECEHSALLSESDDRMFYRRGHYAAKALIQLRSIRRRARDVRRADTFDVIVIYREALFTGSTRFERGFRASRAKIVFDFDDAIWHTDVSPGNRLLGWLKRPGKTREIIALSDLVIAGNGVLAEYARAANTNVVVIPTTIDTDRYGLAPRPPAVGPVTIGWTGSATTMKHFELAVPFLQTLKMRHGDRIAVKVIGDATYVNDALGVRGVAWRRDREIEDLATIDIGIMPLPDDEWAKGKCGLKGLQYMALGIPPLLSPVGVNREIVQHGVNGFLPGTAEEWVEQIDALIRTPELRRRIGAAARQTVVDRYSLSAWQDRYLELFDRLISAPSAANTRRVHQSR